jgi:hypothetical protein
MPPAPGLRSALATVADGYLRFLHTGPDPGTGDDTKAFAGHHAACRAALAHLEHLLKLAPFMGAEGAERDEATTILVEARDAIAAIEEDDHHGEEEQV